jgi:hypothetical protein
MSIPARWKPGQSGNPAGRPKGSKNELTIVKNDLELAIRKSLKPSKVAAILNKMVEMALEGDVKAARLILDKTVSNASMSKDDPQGESGMFVFKVQNLTLKAEAENPAIDAEFSEVTKEEVTVSTGAKQENQSRTQTDAGGQVVGEAPKSRLHQPPNFQGKSGQADNQSTNRPKGQS